MSGLGLGGENSAEEMMMIWNDDMTLDDVYGDGLARCILRHI